MTDLCCVVVECPVVSGSTVWRARNVGLVHNQLLFYEKMMTSCDMP